MGYYRCEVTVSDAKLRELERRWKETGSVEDEAAYLLQRVRVGDLSRERLELAAYCGHLGAIAAKHATVSAPSELAAWVRGLRGWLDDQTMRLVALVVARMALDNWESQPNFDATWMYAPRRGMIAARSYLAEPTDENRRALSGFAAGCEGLADPLDPTAVLPEESAAGCATFALRSLLNDSPSENVVEAAVQCGRTRSDEEVRRHLSGLLSDWSLKRPGALLADALRTLAVDDLAP